MSKDKIVYAITLMIAIGIVFVILMKPPTETRTEIVGGYYTGIGQTHIGVGVVMDWVDIKTVDYWFDNCSFHWNDSNTIRFKSLEDRQNELSWLVGKQFDSAMNPIPRYFNMTYHIQGGNYYLVKVHEELEPTITTKGGECSLVWRKVN